MEPIINQNIQQLNIGYNPIEDRLLFKLKSGSNQEYRLWFTRRFSKLLLSLLIDKMDTFGGIDSIGVSEDTQAVIKNGALEKKYIAPIAPQYPLGKAGIIPTKMNISQLKNNTISINFLNNDNKGMKFNMDKKMLYLTHNLLTQGINKADWDLATDESVKSGEINFH